jgi:hypothetical protein
MRTKWLASSLVFSVVLAMAACERSRLTEGNSGPGLETAGTEDTTHEEKRKGKGNNENQPGTATLNLTYNVTPNPEWQCGQSVLLYADARRNPNIGEEDIFESIQFPGTYPREANQVLQFNVDNVNVGETIIVQGYICSEEGGDCYPSDRDNPPSCSVEVRILDNFQPSCRPTFTWTGGEENSGVVCQATCP